MEGQLNHCIRCGGLLSRDLDELRCLQCGRCYYGESVSSKAPDDISLEPKLDGQGKTGSARRALRNINSQISAREKSDCNWLSRYQAVIRHIDQGLSVREIATKLGMGEKHVRVIRQRLRESRLSYPTE